MEMTIIHNEKRLCTCCMEEHDIKTVRLADHTLFKNIPVEYEATYFYCDAAEELYMDEHQIRENDIAIKDAYRSSQGLLTSKEITGIRAKYGITQSDLCVLLGWGGKTITRYETHQVQDRAHDTILKKLDNDPEWFLSLLIESKKNISAASYKRYLRIARALYEGSQDLYLRKSIEAKYTPFQGDPSMTGNQSLSLDKVVDVIRYFASTSAVTNLYKVKLMKLLWYADSLSYQKRGASITGLVYQALPMGAVPIGHDSIIDLKNVPCKEVDMGESYAYYFSLSECSEYPFLTADDISIMDIVIRKFGKMSKHEIVNYMHQERAYLETPPREIISFEYAKHIHSVH